MSRQQSRIAIGTMRGAKKTLRCAIAFYIPSRRLIPLANFGKRAQPAARMNLSGQHAAVQKNVEEDV